MLPTLLPQLSDFVRARLGLHFPPERFADLERGVHAAAAELGFSDAEEWARELLDAPHTDEETVVLAGHLTVAETYFFRDPAAFEALEHIALPELLNRRARPLRIWSAACCTGEEAYSLAISVQRMSGKGESPRGRVLATDLNPRFLKKAAAGMFGQWSFRGVAKEVRARYFEPVDAAHWRVAPEVRSMVDFEALNLFDVTWPRSVDESGGMDVIFCRNVLMYFASDDARRIAGKVGDVLSDGGWLFASAAEASHDLFADLTRADVPGVSAFRKLARPAEGAAERKGACPSIDSPLASDGIGGPCAVVSAEAVSVSPAPPAPETLDAAGHYLRGITLQESGALDEAAAALRRALYLTPDFILAHFALGNLMCRTGREREAARNFENARALLHGLDPGAALPQGDGLTAARLLAVLDARPEVGT